MEHLVSDWIGVLDYFVFRTRGDVLFPSGSLFCYEGLCKVSLLLYSLGKPKGLYYGGLGSCFSLGVLPKLVKYLGLGIRSSSIVSLQDDPA